MLQKMKKMLAACCVFAMIITMMPIPVQAAIPRYVKTYAYLYENGTTKGVYTFKLQNLKKGQKVKWSISGAGKAYAKLQKKSTTVTGTTATNKVTINTGGKTAVNNKRVILVAKIYSSKGKLQYTVRAKGNKIRVYPKTVTLSGDALTSGILEIGKSYQVNATITPANALYAKNWIVTNAAGEDYSDYITSNGVFTPKKPGNYTITCQAKIASKVIRTAKADVTVANTMMEVKQVAANKLQAIYASDVREQVTIDNYSIRSAAGSVILPKELSFSEDGTVATIKTSTLFKDATSYTVSDGNKSISFTASVGKPASVDILTEAATVKKETAIEYAVYDAQGVDVTAAYEGTVTYRVEITNGYLTTANKVYMTEVGKYGLVEITYTNKADVTNVLSNKKAILCKAAATSTKTNFTLTTDQKTPEYASSTYKDNLKAAIGTTYYAHFRALDDDGTEIPYESISYECSDPDTLIIAKDGKDGKVTPIKQGSVKIVVSAKYAGETYDYVYDVTVTEAKYLASLNVSTATLTMSNAYADGYKGYIDVTGLDQYGEPISLTSETATMTESSSVKANMAVYNALTNQIEVSAVGKKEDSYAYTLTLTQNGKSATVNFVVVVRVPPANGALSYALESDKSVVDLAITSDTTTDRTCRVRLAQYRGGVFDGYMYMTSMTIRKGEKYYQSDLTKDGTAAASTVTVNASYLDLTAMKIGSDNVCKKAETGSYIMEVKFTSGTSQASASGAVTLIDSQPQPGVSINKTTATQFCASAVLLARHCLSVTDGNIIECSVTGDSKKGSEFTLSTGQQVNIASVTVQSTMTAGGKVIIYTYVVPVGKTLKNY